LSEVRVGRPIAEHTAQLRGRHTSDGFCLGFYYIICDDDGFISRESACRYASQRPGGEYAYPSHTLDSFSDMLLPIHNIRGYILLAAQASQPLGASEACLFLGGLAHNLSSIKKSHRFHFGELSALVTR
jgi:hypothetical protein